MVNKQLLSLLSIVLAFVFVNEAPAQFSPGKKVDAGVAVEYNKAKTDSLKVRKSMQQQKKKQGAGMVSASEKRTSVKSSNVKKKQTRGDANDNSKKAAGVKRGKVDSLHFEPVTYRLGDRVIMRGDSGKDVRSVARILVKKLYIGEDSVIYTKDGGVLYDGDLVRAVKHFQEFNGLYPDGIIGFDVVKALRRRK